MSRLRCNVNIQIDKNPGTLDLANSKVRLLGHLSLLWNHSVHGADQTLRPFFPCRNYKSCSPLAIIRIHLCSQVLGKRILEFPYR